jgi:hypothetical protein
MVRSRHERVMFQCFPSIKCLNRQVFVKAPISAVTTLIFVACSFVGKNVHEKWLLIVIGIIRNDKIVLGRCLLKQFKGFLYVCRYRMNFR